MSDDSADVLARIDETLHQVDAADEAWRRAALARPGMAVYEPGAGSRAVLFRPGVAVVRGRRWSVDPPAAVGPAGAQVFWTPGPGERLVDLDPATPSEPPEAPCAPDTPRKGSLGAQRGAQQAAGAIFGRSPTSRRRRRRRLLSAAIGAAVGLALAALTLLVTRWSP